MHQEGSPPMLRSNIYVHRSTASGLYLVCDQVGSTSMAHLNRFILGLGTYFYPANVLSEKLRNVPQNEEAMQVKSKMLHCSYD